DTRPARARAGQVLPSPPPGGAMGRRPGRPPGLGGPAVAPTPPPRGGRRYVHLADRAGDITELLDYADEHGLCSVARSQHDRGCAIGGPITKPHQAAPRRPAAGPPPRPPGAAPQGGPPPGGAGPTGPPARAPPRAP